MRFASPTPVGADLTVDAYGINEQSFAFEAACGRCGRHHPGKVGAAAMAGLDIGVYVPQMGFSYRDVLHRAQRCEELSIGSVWLYDHLYGPGVPDIASLEAWSWPPRCSAAPSDSELDIWCCATSFATRRCWPRWRPPSTRCRPAG